MTVVKPTKEELVEAWMEDSEDFEQVHREADDSWRHGSYVTEIFKRISDNTYWEVYYRRSGDGEYNGMRENEFSFQQVEPKEVTKVVYVPVKV